MRVDGPDIVCEFERTERVTRCGNHEEALQRVAVCNEVRRWLKTPYHHMGRVLSGGVDCATLLAEVYPAAGVVKQRVEVDFYPMDWNLHRDAERYLAYITQYMREIPVEDIKIGDVLMFKWGRTMAHGGIIIDPGYPFLIHAARDVGMVAFGNAEEGMMGEQDRPKRAFTPW